MIKHTIFGREGIDQKTIDQFYDAISNPYTIEAALMPDAHFGYTMPIGGVAAVEGAIFPEWIGYDIGCGVCAAKTNFEFNDIFKERKDIFNIIYKVIPTGFNHHTISTWTPSVQGDPTNWFKEMYARTNGALQLGTLGSGNHFIEIGHSGRSIWIIVHSGSRNVGHQTATYYMKKAREIDPDHGALLVNSTIGQEYIRDMNMCLEFALQNRRYIIKRVIEGLWALGIEGDESGEMFINRNHNHAVERELDDKQVWIHRKGATHSEDGMLGIIPGNMRDGSCIVRGKGCREALFSSSHGAGRTMSRKQAKQDLHLIDFQNQMNGITSKVDLGTLDESPGAYKDFESVLELQEDMVEVIDRIVPLINVKA